MTAKIEGGNIIRLLPSIQTKAENGHKLLEECQVTQSNVMQARCFYTPYLSEDEVEQGLASKIFFEGTLRINQRKYEEGFVDNPEGGEESDVLIYGLRDRNRALQGDRVVFKIKERLDWAVSDVLYKLWKKQIGSNENLCEEGELEAERVNKSSKKATDNAFSDFPSKKKMDVVVQKHLTYTKEELLLLREKVIKRQEAAEADVKSTFFVSEKQEKPLKEVRNQLYFLRDLPEEEQALPDACLQKTAEVIYVYRSLNLLKAVVFIIEKKHSRVAVGSLKVLANGNRKWILFSPNDSRIPRMMIPSEQAPLTFFDRPQDFSKSLYVAHMLEWPCSSLFAPGQLGDFLGSAGEIKSETNGLLLMNGVDTSEFPEAALSSLNLTEGTEQKIIGEEIKYRRDFRKEVLFTIDPITARDLDDALHIKPIQDCDGTGRPGWEVGVHIADVSYFVKAGTELDNRAAGRGNSVYLVDKVIPMLPTVLCEKLCSLSAGVDRLAMSVVWKMDDEANVYEEWFGRSVIHSCCKLSYEHAQEMIESSDEIANEASYPEVYNGKSLQDIKASILHLNKLAVFLCDRRTKNGFLRIEQPKLHFDLNEKGAPCGVSVYERKQANSLVEEFMLLANIAVARKIEKAFPKEALLRRHPPPKANVFRAVLEKCRLAGFDVDGTSSGSLASSLKKYAIQNKSQIAVVQVLSSLLLKSMQPALYFCTGTKKDKSEYAHYALSVPFYTHFTSPIRRYPDIMVHRFLSAALKYEPAPCLSIEELSSLASHCNDRKFAAKCVSEASAEMFFGLFIKECGPLLEKAVVMQVLDASFDVFIVKYGLIKRVYINKINFAKPPEYREDEGILPFLTLYWTREGSQEILKQKIRLCTVLDVMLSPLSESVKFQASLVKPNTAKDSTLFDFLSDKASFGVDRFSP